MNFVSQILKTKGDKVWSIAPQETAYKALQFNVWEELGALVVIDKGKVVGLFTERDYARKVILKGKSSKTTAVSELMTEKRVRHLPVMEKKHLVWIVTVGDVVRQLIADQKFKIQELERYIHEEC